MAIFPICFLLKNGVEGSIGGWLGKRTKALFYASCVWEFIINDGSAVVVKLLGKLNIV
jgi:hypothetical protein